VTLTLRAKSNKDLTVGRVASEISAAANIKCKQTRKDVIAALRRLQRFLQHQLGRVPDTGIAMFASEDSMVAVVPDRALETNDYVCGKTFDTAPVEQRLVRKTDVLIGWALLTGEAIEYGDNSHDKTTRLSRPGGKLKRHNKGGQSAPRFQRMFDAADDAWIKQAGTWLLAAIQPGTQHVFLGGPGIQHRDLTPYLGAQPTFQLHPSSFEGPMAAWGRQVQDTLWPQLSRTIAAATARECRAMLEESPDIVCVGLPMCQRAAAEGVVKRLWIERGVEGMCEPHPVGDVTELPAGALAELGGVVAELHYPCEWLYTDVGAAAADADFIN